MDRRNGNGGNGPDDLDDDLDDDFDDLDDDDLVAVLRLIAERAGEVIMIHYAEGENIEVRMLWFWVLAISPLFQPWMYSPRCLMKARYVF